MGLRLKTAATITAVFLGLLGALYGIFSHVILSQFSSIEIQRASHDLSRTIEAIDRARDSFAKHLSAWGARADAPSTTPEFEFTDLAIISESGDVLLSGRRNHSSHSIEELPEIARRALVNHPQALALIRGERHDDVSTFVQGETGPRILGAARITAPKATLPGASFIISTATISPSLLTHKGQSMTLQPSASESLGTAGSNMISVAVRESEVEAVGTIRDALGRSLASVSLREPRALSAQGRAALYNVILSVAVFLVIANAVVLIFLDKAILTPMRSISSIMNQITRTRDLTLRIPTRRDDEIGVLGRSINALLESNERSYSDMLTARDEAEKANRGKSMFIAKVSHELRTPIHSITGMLRILLKQEPPGGKRQYIQMAQDSAKGLLETINEILDFSKMQTGSLSLEKLEFSLYETIRATVSQLIPRFEEKEGIELCWDIKPGVPDFIIGDPLRLKNIITNLLGNAFKFTHAGHVSLAVTPYGSGVAGSVGVRFEVTDSGIGISEDRLENIFDPFVTGDDSTARLYAGTGLGLAIVKQAVEQMGGRIWATSVLNQGTTFTVEIPFPTGASALSRELEPLREEQAIAILGDDSVDGAFLREGLERYGWKATLFAAEQSDGISSLLTSLSSFDLIHISGTNQILPDELTPLIRAASQGNIPLVMSLRTAEMASADRFPRSERFFLTHKPVSALDLLLIASGKLVPSTTITTEEEVNETSEHKLNILIADDAATNRIILKTLLEESGHSVEVVENGRQLLERVMDSEKGQESLDLVMTDIQMPIMDGLTAAQRVRELEKSRNTSKKIPIVAVTAYAFPDECTQMKASGIDYIITKPISPKRLSGLLSQISCEVVSKAPEDSGGADAEILNELRGIIEEFSESSELEKASITLPEGGMLLDIADVFERSGDSLRRTAMILSGFLGSYQDPLHELDTTTLPPAKPAELRRAAHSLKGLLLDVGARDIAAIAHEVERLAMTEPERLTRNSLTELARGVQVVVSLLERLVGAIPSLEIFAALPPIDDALSFQ